MKLDLQTFLFREKWGNKRTINNNDLIVARTQMFFAFINLFHFHLFLIHSKKKIKHFEMCIYNGMEMLLFCFPVTLKLELILLDGCHISNLWSVLAHCRIEVLFDTSWIITLNMPKINVEWFYIFNHKLVFYMFCFFKFSNENLSKQSIYWVLYACSGLFWNKKPS